MTNRGEPDPVDVQISFNVRLPKGARVTKDALNAVYKKWVDDGKLPKFMTIRGIFWRNPARKGALHDWRYSEGSDLSLAPRGGVESTPRGSHEDARITLNGFLQTLKPFS